MGLPWMLVGAAAILLVTRQTSAQSDIFGEGKSDKEILDNLLLAKRYDKRLLPPVTDADFCCDLHTPEDGNNKHDVHLSNKSRGYKEFGISPMEPLVVNEVTVEQEPGPISLYQKYRDIRLSGLSTTKVTKFILDLNNCQMYLEVRIPSVRANAAYEFKGQILVFEINAEGNFASNIRTLVVNISVLLLSLASPDESSLKYEVEFLLQQQWYDPRLRYANQSRYEYLNAIHHNNDIWLPDTYFIMHGDFKDPLIPVHFSLRIYRNGTVHYVMRRHLILSCQGSLNIFPFDDPLCSFAMESISYEQTAIKYVWKNDEDTLRKSPSLTSLNAYLISNQTIECPTKASWRENYSCLKVELIFTRDRAFYFTTVFIPGIILVTSSFITFWLEWNAVPARVMIGVTTMLNFFTTSNGFRSTLPVVSNLTAMNVWDGVCMCFIYASLLEFVCVNYVGRKRPLHNVVYRPGENPVTQRLPAVLSRIGIILASPLGDKKRDTAIPNEIVSCTTCGANPCTHTANNGCATEVRKKEPPHPIRVAKTIDVIARVTFPTAFSVFLIFFFCHYKSFTVTESPHDNT